MRKGTLFCSLLCPQYLNVVVSGIQQLLNKNLLNKQACVFFPLQRWRTILSILTLEGTVSWSPGGGHMHGPSRGHAGPAILHCQQRHLWGLSEPAAQKWGFVTHCCFNNQNWALGTVSISGNSEIYFGEKALEEIGLFMVSCHQDSHVYYWDHCRVCRLDTLRLHLHFPL